MAEKLCSLRKKGSGKMSETVLWTNPNPTSASGFASQTVNLSKDISNYTYVKVVAYWAIINSTEHVVIIPVSEFITYETTNSLCGALSLNAGGYLYTRSFYRASNTSVTFDNCKQISTGSGVANTALVPTQIIGLK